MSKAIVTAIAGVDVDSVYTTAPMALGTVVTGSDGIKYMLVLSGEEISTTTNEPYSLAIDEAFTAMKSTAALGLVGHRFGIAPRQIIATASYFWARIDGHNVPIRVAASAAADARLGHGGVGTTAGRMASSVTASAGNAVVFGLVITAAGSASASAGNTIRNAIMTSPVWTTAVAD